MRTVTRFLHSLACHYTGRPLRARGAIFFYLAAVAGFALFTAFIIVSP